MGDEDMNYIREINAFYDWLETNTISDSAISLWHALMHINNKTGWKNEFTVALSVLEAKTGLKKDALIRARKTLQKVNRISFKSRSGMQSAIYKIIPLEPYANGTPENCVVLSDTKCDTNHNTNRAQTATQSATQTASITKLNETKRNNKNIYNAETEQEILSHWNSKDIVVHKKLTNNLHISIKRALTIYSLEDIKTAIDHYATMYHDAEYSYCSYRWGIEKFLDDPKGIESFFDDGQKWLSYLNRKDNKKQPIEQEELVYDNW